jgi:cell division protein FtsN
MKKADFKEKSSTFIISKGLIIAVIIFTSSASFILGYFVGKNVPKKASETKLPLENRQEKNTLPEEILSQYTVQPKSVAPAGEKGVQKEIKEVEKKVPKDSQQPQKQTKIVYTVQVGAFKDAPDAESLKAKLDKKGFKTYVTPSESKKEGRLYKVWIGEFNTRKEAEILSQKIKKSERLQAFVILKKEEESIRRH